MYKIFLIFFLFLSINNICIADCIYHQPSKYRYDINVDHQVTGSGTQTRGYVRTTAMFLNNYSSAFEPYMYTAYSRWCFAVSCRDSYDKILPGDRSKWQGAGHYVTGLVQQVRVKDDGRLCAFSDKMWNALVEKCKHQKNSGSLNGNKLELNDLNHTGDNPDLSYYDDVDLRDLHEDTSFSIGCSSSGPDCKVIRALCSYVHSAQLADHLIKCLQIPFNPPPGKMYNYVPSSEKPRIIKSVNSSFLKPQIIVALGSNVMRCPNNEYVIKKLCSDNSVPVKVDAEYKEQIFNLDFKNDPQYTTKINFQDKEIVLSVDKREICAKLESDNSYLNCIPREKIAKPSNINYQVDNNHVVFSAELKNVAEKIQVKIPFNSSQKDPLQMINSVSRDGRFANEYSIGGYTFHFIRSKVQNNKNKLQKKCSYTKNNKNFTFTVKTNESCDDKKTKLIPIVDAQLCKNKVQNKGEYCHLTAQPIKAKKCLDNHLIPVASGSAQKTSDCINSEIDFFDEPDGDHLCLAGWDDGEKILIDKNKKEHLVYEDANFWEVAIAPNPHNQKESMWQITNRPSSLDLSNLTNEERQSIRYTTMNIFGILKKNTNKFTYYRWQNRISRYNQGQNSAHWFYKFDDKPILEDNFESMMIPKSPAELGLCIPLDSSLHT